MILITRYHREIQHCEVGWSVPFHIVLQPNLRPSINQPLGGQGEGDRNRNKGPSHPNHPNSEDVLIHYAHLSIYATRSDQELPIFTLIAAMGKYALLSPILYTSTKEQLVRGTILSHCKQADKLLIKSNSVKNYSMRISVTEIRKLIKSRRKNFRIHFRRKELFDLVNFDSQESKCLNAVL